MIDRIRISNFKCFLDESIELRPLSVLSGINGMGKSSCLQSLLLLRQSWLSSASMDKALLNGPLISLGHPDDVLYEGVQDSELITLALTENGSEQKFSFKYAPGCKEMYGVDLQQVNPNNTLWGEQFFYLKAERIGPRTSFQSINENGNRHNVIGNAGEYCAYLLATHERKPVGSEKLLHNSQPLNELRLQVEAWLAEIGQTPRIHLNEYTSMDRVNMQFSFLRDGIPSSNYRPTNVGFGLTYTLPIFVACLMAKPGGMVLIENPEAHLHPKGQVAMGKFLAHVADSGIQVIIETHSDHVLNGIRIAAKNQVINPEGVALHFFQHNADSQSTSIVTPKMDADGRLDQWPDGFFDEWEKGLAELL
ncbi:MAG: DUF3696 domain-containing protein [Methylobacter sp.]|uniref:AAA family ATPase n=1 Tax=Methylobacter sp. TaxID=2051955 RepID=UPI002589398D|nr:DUF3696 domain-containing protein [Methylobacter sp.]MCL7421791.1 DUF3696 domain-containing protein [Methylobacter sp.]